MSATEMISYEMSNFMDSSELSHSQKGKFSEISHNINSSLSIINDIHSFMMMVINRCVDFTKASRGIELKATVETIDFQRVVSLPVHCMMNIQQKIPIEIILPGDTRRTISPLPSPTSHKEGWGFGNKWREDSTLPLHSFIKTDKTWLEENLLCVLSNAIKHSSSGKVIFRISILNSKNMKHFHYKPSKIIDEVIVHGSGRGNFRDEEEEDGASSTFSPNPKTRNSKMHGGETFRRITNMLTPTTRRFTTGSSISAVSIRSNPSVFGGKSVNLRVFKSKADAVREELSDLSITAHHLELKKGDIEEGGVAGNIGGDGGDYISPRSSFEVKRKFSNSSFVNAPSTNNNNKNKKYQSDEETNRRRSSLLSLFARREDPNEVTSFSDHNNSNHNNETGLSDYEKQKRKQIFSISNQEQHRRRSSILALFSPKRVAAAASMASNEGSSVYLSPRPQPLQVEKEGEEDNGTHANHNAPKEFLLFEIIDNGKGLSTYELMTFFNPFKQKRLSGGTGLGLYSLAKRVECLGGKYGVQPRTDGHTGTIVWFTIPYTPDLSKGSSFVSSPSTLPQNTSVHLFQSKKDLPPYTQHHHHHPHPHHPTQHQQHSDHQKKEHLHQQITTPRSKDVSSASDDNKEDEDDEGLPEKSKMGLDCGPFTTSILSSDSQLYIPPPTITLPSEAKATEGTTFFSSPSEINSVNNNIHKNNKTSGSSKKIKEESKKLMILVVEDAPMIAKVTCRLLEKQGHLTEIAENGQIALEKVLASYKENNYETTKYDFLLMDFQMPVLDGLEATYQIRQFERMKNIRIRQLIVGISAMSDTETVDLAREKGINDFLPKPFSIQNVLMYYKNLREKQLEK
jgi:CheY-like chemotaxis protein